MLPKKLKKIVDEKKTLLFVGVMSKNVVDATIEISDEYNIPLTLIASRRQVDSKKTGGGYANNWNTRTFSQYVKKKSKLKNIFLARDHGGPWQGNIEIKNKYNLTKAMQAARESFKEDIDNNFDFIHIDTSESIFPVSKKQAYNRLCSLYSFCNSYAKRKKKKVFFEIGTEEQSGFSGNLQDFSNTLKAFKKFCLKKKLQWPSFVVAQCGTKVMETKNIGTFETLYNIKNELPVEITLFKTLDVCKENKIIMKEHNADYLNNVSLQWHPRLGLQAVNVAPEFGVAETKCLIECLKKYNCKNELSNFIKIANKSGKWIKWVMKHSKKSAKDKAIISGHYVFNDPSVIEIKNKLRLIMRKKKLNLDNILKESVKKVILRYLKSFRVL